MKNLWRMIKNQIYADVVSEHEFRATNYTILLICLSFIIMSMTGYFVYKSLAKKQIFPKKENRYDITTLWVGIAEEVCGDLGESPLLGARIEECVKDLSLNETKRSPSWVKFDIPDLDTIMDTYRPSFGGNLKYVEPGGKEIHRKIYSEKQPTVIGINIPAKYFKINRVDADFYALVYNQALFARVCIAGRCNFRSTVFKYGGHSFPLISNKSIDNEEGFIPVFIFIEHLKHAYSLNLQDGVFVAKESELNKINKLYPINLSTQSFIFALGFLSVLLLSLWQAVLWRKYADYGAFVYFCASLTTLAISINATLFPFSPNWYAFWWLNTFWSYSFFSLTLLRQRRFSVVMLFIGLVFSYILAVVFINANSSISYIDRLDFFQGFINVMIAIVPTSIFLLGIFVTNKMIKKTDRKSSKEALIKRRNGFVMMFFLAILLGFTFFLNGLFLIFDISAIEDHFHFWTVFAVVGMMATLFHPTFSLIKKTLDKAYPKSEVERLKLLLPNQEYQKWLSTDKCGVFIELDLAASSRLTKVIQERFQTMMEFINHCVLEDLHREGFHIVLAKPVGDAYVYIIDADEHELVKKSIELISFLKKNAAKYDELPRVFYRNYRGEQDEAYLKVSDVYVHFLLAVVGRYTLGSSTEQIDTKLKEEVENLSGHVWQTKLAEQRIDFISEEMNHILKLIPKAPIDTLTVAASRLRFNEIIGNQEKVQELPKTEIVFTSINLRPNFEIKKAE